MPGNSTYEYAPLLTAIVVLLALVFLVSGLVVLFSRRHRGSGHRSGVSLQSRKYASVAALVTPTILLCFGILFVSLTTTPVTTPPTPTSTPPLPTPSQTVINTVSPEPKPTLQPPVKPGFLTVGVLDQDNPSPPEIYYQPNQSGGQDATGFDIDLIKEIAKNMNLKPDIKPSKQPLDDLKKKQVDVVISAYSVNTEGNLSVPYLAPKDVLLVSNEENSNQLKFDTWPDLCAYKDKIKIGVQANTTEQSALKSFLASCQTMIKDDYSSAEKLADALLKKEVDAIYQSTPIESYYQIKHKDKFIRVGNATPISQEGILIRHDNKPLCDSIQAAFNSLVDNGWYKDNLNRPDGNLTADNVTPDPVATPTLSP